MALADLSVASPVSAGLIAPPQGGTAAPTVIALRGEHDWATAPELAAALARAIAQDDSAALVVDLGAVTFMDAATVGVLVRAGGFLGERARTFSVRTPSACARRVIEICDLGHLIEGSPIAP